MSARTATTSVFQNPDGSKTMRVYSRPVHYKKADGSWDNIDTGLTQRRDNRWAETANDQDLSFSPKADGAALLAWSLDSGHQVSYTLQGANPASAIAASDTLTYPGAVQSTDVVYNALATGIKESLVLHDASAPTSFVFPLSLTGLTAAVDGSGNVRFTDADGKVRMTIPHGFMQDSAHGVASGEGALSTGVTYRLVASGGGTALEMDLDPAWLHDAHRVFPVRVDPTATQVNATRSTYVSTNYNQNFSSSSDIRVGSYDNGSSMDTGYVVFDSVGSTTLQNEYVEKAELDLNATWSGACNSQSHVNVHAITSAWDPSSVTSPSQVPYDGNVLGSAAFQAYDDQCPSNAPMSITVPFDIGDNPSAAGVQLVNGWTHQSSGNFGLALTANSNSLSDWSHFDSVNTQYPPYLKITYTDWAATYYTDGSYTPPTYNTPGSQQVTLTNQAPNWWNSSSMQIKARFFDANWNEQFPATAPLTSVPGASTPVKTGQSVTMTGVIPAFRPGTSYQMCWDGYVSGSSSLYDVYGVPFSHCTWVQAVNVAPQIDVTSPQSNSVVGTVAPQLYASGHDPDNYPGSGLSYEFQVYAGQSTGTPLVDSGWQSNSSWAVPSGKLAWNAGYVWTVRVGDGVTSSAWSNFAAFSTQVQQPVITSHLGGAADDGSGHTFDPQVGNYTTDASDASVKVVGPALAVTRSYNSLDPRTSNLFGAGWTSAFDMNVQPDGDGTGAVVVTTADGKTARFGQNPSGGSVYTPPAGSFASLTARSGGGYVLLVKGGTQYTFGEQAANGAYVLSSVKDADGHGQNLAYDGTTGLLTTVTDAVSSRSLHFTWTASGRHVAKVSTDPVTGTDASTALTWTYTYNSADSDELDQVCAPPTSGNTAASCTTYSYTAYSYSHLRSAVLDTAPSSYWRLGESSGATTAGSEVIANLGNDSARYSSTGVSLGGPGPTRSAATAASFDGSSGYVSLPQSILATSSYTSVGLWFETTGQGVLFSYQTDTFPAATTSHMYTPALYVGTSGKLYGEFWQGTVNPVASKSTVNDGKWHFALLTAAGNTQTLYVDGSAQGTISGQVIAPSQLTETVGGGFIGGGWPDEPFHSTTDNTGHAGYINATISDVAFYDHALGAPAVASLDQAGTEASAELSSVVLPSGKTKLAVTYNAVADRATKVTDANGGSWTINAPTASGSTQEYRGQVMGSDPAGYWRLSDQAGTQAANEVYTPRPAPDNGTYANVALGAAGPMTGSAASATFDGATSSISLPAKMIPTQGPAAIALWFKTTTAGGTLLGYQDGPIDDNTTRSTRWNPALYVGTDGRLHAQLWTGTPNNTLTSATTVTDGNWHFAVLSADTTTSQTLYLDGQSTAGPLSGTIAPNGTQYLYLGAGNADNWPNAATTPFGHFNGQIANAAIFPHGLPAATVSSLQTQAANQTTTQGVNANQPSAYDTAIISAHPNGYWRLDDTSGNDATELLSSADLAQNRGTYTNTTCCTPGPWASGNATGTTFNGTSSYLQLPANAVPQSNSSATVELWFKTAGPGVLYGYQNFPLGNTNGGQPGVNDLWNPALYVGTDHKLHGLLWTNTNTNTPTTSTQNVDDNTWHHAALTANGSTQQLYLDGQPTGTPVNGAVTYNGSTYAYLGAGYIAGSWPAAPTDTSGHLNGSIADFSLYNYALGASTIHAHHTAATTATNPSGMDAASAYRATIVQDAAYAYWRLNDPSGSSYAADELGTALPDITSGNYTSTTLDTPGPTWQQSATFNGTTSYLQLPTNTAPTQAPASIELWFKTTTAGVLYSYQNFPLGTNHSGTGYAWNPALYVGTDNKLHGWFWTGGGGMTSTGTVTDGTWHQAVLTGDNTGQSLYLDGTKTAASTNAATITYNGTPYVYIGAGTDDQWPNAPTDTSGHLNGSIAEVSYYTNRLNDTTITNHYNAMGNSTTPETVTTAIVTDPGNHGIKYRYDSHTSQLISHTDPSGNTTAYTYDTNGFLYTVTDPDGHTTTTGHDARGNTLSRTTCQNPTTCQTSYATYNLDSTTDHLAPTNDTLASSSDARSSNTSDTTYQTTYTYDTNGNLTATAVPATSDFSKGRTSYTSRTQGTETAVGSDGNPATGTQPTGLPIRQSPYVDNNTYTNVSGVPANLSTQNSYNAAGDLTKTVSPLGLTTTYSYDNLGRPISKTEACANCGQGQTATTNTTTYTWDGQDNPATETDPATTDAVTGTTHTRNTTTTYDADGDPTTQTIADTTGGDAARTTTWAYNTTNDLTAKVTDPAGHATSYHYDAYGRTTSKTDPAGTTYSYDYTPMGWLVETAINNYTGNPDNPVSSRWQAIEARSYDPAGRLATITDAMGRTTHTYYNDDNTVAELDLDGYHNTDGTTRNVILQQNTYDAAGHLTQRVTGGGKTTVINTWDAADRATSTTLDPGGLNRTTTNTYDATGNTLSTKLTDGAQTRETDSTYDATGDVLSNTVINSPQNSVTTDTYDQRGLPLTSVSPDGNATGATPSAFTTTYFHDPLGEPAITDAPPTASTTFNTTTGQAVNLPAAAAETRTGYNTFGETTSSKDPVGNITTTTHTFDTAGEHLSVASNSYTTPDNSTTFTAVTRTDYDALGQPKTITDPKGNVTTNTYDQLGNLVETDLPAINGTTPKWLYTNDLDGEKQSITDPTGAVTLSTYDDLGRAITLTQQVRQTSHTASSTTPALYTGTFSYDDAGNRTATITPDNESSTASYDAAGEQTSITNALNNTTTFAYDVAGERTKTVEPADTLGSNGRTVLVTYDRAAQMTGTTKLDATGATFATTSIQYDANGNPIATTDADGNQSTAKFDAADHLYQQIQPVDATHTITTGYGYDAAGHRTQYQDGNGNNTYTTYNTLGLPESTIEPATPAFPNLTDRTYTTSYDQSSDPVAVLEPGGVKIGSVFDTQGRVLSQTGSGGEATTPTRTLGYDLDGRLTSLSTPKGTQSFTYEDRGTVWSSTGPLGTSSFTYNPDGKLATRNDVSGTTTYTYDAAGRLNTLSDPLTNTTLNYGYYPSGGLKSVGYSNSTTRTFTYDGQQNVASDTLTSSAGTPASINYQYYASGRLKSQSTTGLSGSATNSYSYDAAGRLNNWNNGSSTTSYSYDSNGNLTQSGPTTASYNQRNQLTAASSTAYAYTARGTRTSATTNGTTVTASYDAFDEMTSQGSQAYSYDALGRLVSASGRSFSYDDTSDNLTSDGSENYTRTPDGNLVSIGQNGTSAFAYTNRHGDLVGTFTAGGSSLANSSSFDPWGKPTTSTGSTHDLGYQGGWTDSTNGLINTASRWYDPTTADFTSRDSATLTPATATSSNRYAYANDDPLTYSDPSGHNACFPSIPPVGPRGGSGNPPDDTSTPTGDGIPDTPPSWVPDYVPAPWTAPQPVPSYNYGTQPSTDPGFDWSGVETAGEYIGAGIVLGAVTALAAPLIGGLGAVLAFSHDSCDTTAPTPIDRAKVAPKPCLSCSTPKQSEGADDPEIGRTQLGKQILNSVANLQRQSLSQNQQQTDKMILDELSQIFPDSEFQNDIGYGGSNVDPSRRRTRSTCDRDLPSTDPSFFYAPMTRFGPNPEDCRATGAIAYLQPGDPRPFRLNLNGKWKPAGYDRLPSGNRAALHVIANQLGGANDTMRNFVAGYQNPTNTPAMLALEDKVRASVDHGESVAYAVLPVYDSDPAIPSELQFFAAGSAGFSMDCEIVSYPTPARTATCR